jgi:hypothetical protein
MEGLNGVGDSGKSTVTFGSSFSTTDELILRIAQLGTSILNNFSLTGNLLEAGAISATNNFDVSHGTSDNVLQSTRRLATQDGDSLVTRSQSDGLGSSR